VFYCNKISPPLEQSNPITVKDEEEIGQEYFKFEVDPHEHLKSANAQYSENYIADRYYIQKNNREFMSDHQKSK
jgi:hypothetical protein